MAKKKESKQTPLEEMRGVASFDTNELLVFVRAAVEEAAAAFQRLRKLKTWIKKAGGKTVTVTEPSYVVYRLKGHIWTIIDTYKASKRYVDEKDAKELSKTLKTK